MARRKTQSRPAAPAPRAGRAVPHAIYEAKALAHAETLKQLDAARADIETLRRRAEDAERDYAATANLRGAYERVVTERNDATSRAQGLDESLMRARTDIGALNDRIARATANLDAANYRAACAEADARAARGALAEQSMLSAAATRDLRAARRDAAERDRLNPREIPTMLDGATYHGPLAAPDIDIDDIL